MKPKLFFLFAAALVAFSFVPYVQAWGPTTHLYISTRFLTDSRVQSSSIVQLIKQNRQCFDAGFIITDLTVFYYYSSGSKYEATHAWAFQEEMMRLAETDCEKALSYGIAAHLIQDSVSHNEYVPGKITAYNIPNWFIHPVSEGIIESHIIRDYPQEYTRIQNVLKPVLQNPTLMSKLQQAITKSSGMGSDELNVAEMTEVFDDVLGDPGGFYTKYFALPDIYKSVSEGNFTVGILLVIVAAIFIVLAWRVSPILIIPAVLLILAAAFMMVGGLAGLTDISDFDRYMQMSIDRSTEVFKTGGWDNRYLYDPTGFNALAQADSQISLVWVGVLAAIAIITAAYFVREWL